MVLAAYKHWKQELFIKVKGERQDDSEAGTRIAMIIVA